MSLSFKLMIRNRESLSISASRIIIPSSAMFRYLKIKQVANLLGNLFNIRVGYGQEASAGRVLKRIG